jgi:hypothetical protein
VWPGLTDAQTRCAPADEAKPPAKNAKSAKVMAALSPFSSAASLTASSQAAAPAEAAPASKPRARKAR